MALKRLIDQKKLQLARKVIYMDAQLDVCVNSYVVSVFVRMLVFVNLCVSVCLWSFVLCWFFISRRSESFFLFCGVSSDTYR